MIFKEEKVAIDNKTTTVDREIAENAPFTATRVKQIHSYDQRPKALGKFLYIGDEKYWVCGVTYGTFRPGEDGNQFPDPEVVDRDFSAIAENNMNPVRTYTVPPLWLLDIARKHGLRWSAPIHCNTFKVSVCVQTDSWSVADAACIASTVSGAGQNHHP